MTSPDTVTSERLWAALTEVMDPELGISITDLGLVYGIDIDCGRVTIEMTTTNPLCPLASYLERQIEQCLSPIAGIDAIAVRVTHTPRWTPEMMNDAARHQLGWSG